MRTKRSSTRWYEALDEMEAPVATEEESVTLASHEPALAIELPAEDATPASGMKRSRVHEVFTADPNNSDYSVCQCVEKIYGRSVCGQRIKSTSGTKPLWNHIEKKHPIMHTKLKVDAGDADITHTSAAERLQSPAQLTLNVSYQHMVDTLCSAPAEILSDAIEALQQARDRRS